VDLSKTNPDQLVIEPFLKLGRFAPFQYERAPYETKIRVFKGRCAAWIVVLLILAWFAALCAVFYNVKYRRGFSDARFSQVIGLPFTLDVYRRSKAEFYLRRGHDLFAKQDYVSAFHALRAGLREVPEDNEARRRVVELYLSVRRIDLARPLIVDGLAHSASQPEYLTWVFASLLRLQEDDLVVELATEFLRALPDADPNTRHAALMAEATAHHLRGRFAAAEATLRRENSFVTLDGMLLLARNAREQGRNEAALNILREALLRNPDADEPYTELLTEIRRQGRNDELRRLILQRQIARPDDLRPLLDDLLRLQLEGAEDAALALEDQIWSRFGEDPAALDNLSLVASQLGRHTLARRVLEQRRAQGLDLTTPITGLVEALLKAGRHEEALAEIRAFPEAEKNNGFLALEAIAMQGLGKDIQARGLALRYMDQILLRAELLITLMERLQALGADETAVIVGDKLLLLNPFFQPVLEQRLRTALNDGTWEKAVGYVYNYTQTRRPSEGLMRNIQDALQSDRHHFLPGRVAALSALAAALAKTE
jgi:tetratricopeptide (TPR) repeat protein